MDDRGHRLTVSAARVVAELTGGPVERVEEIHRGVMTYKFAVWSAKGIAYIVRFYPPTRDSIVDFEPDLVRRCAEHGSPVPRVVADSRTGPKVELKYMVYRRLEGEPIAGRFASFPTERRRRLGERVVECLSALSEIKFDGSGELINAWRAGNSSWRDFVHHSFREGLESAGTSHLFSSGQVEKLRKLGSRVEDFVPIQANSLVWVDIGLENILADDRGEFIGLIDFEGALAGDPLLALGACYAACGEDMFFGSLMRAWPSPIDDAMWRLVRFYAILRTLRVAKHADRPLPTGQPRAPLLSIFPGFPLALEKL